jgi:tRNA pseudouridine38-40 synthase
MPERNIRLLLEYDGTNYHGWQSQENAFTIQDTLELAMEKLFQQRIRVTGAGRTDAGVHAKGQVVNFHLQKDLSLRKIILGLNAHLPNDIVVKKVEVTEPQFHARFDAKQRIYCYYVSLERTAIYRKYCWQVFQNIDVSVLQHLASLLIGEHDFSAFARLEKSTGSKKCVVVESNWKNKNNFLIYRICANRFLHGMVRGIVGTMLDVARGRFTQADFEEIFRSYNRTMAGVSAPPQGLFLEEIIY